MKVSAVIRLALLGALLLGAVVLAWAGSNGTNSFSFPLDGIELPGPNGETITLSGTIHRTVHTTVNNNIVTVNLHENYQNSSGIDLITENVYQVNSVSNYWEHFSGEGGVDYMLNQTVVMVSQGAAPNLVMHTVTHVNISASGEASAEIVDMYLTN